MTHAGANSEVGRLRTVMLHRPGPELARLTPRNNDSLLFDGIPWVGRAQDEHDAFAQALRDHDVEVLYLVELLTEALEKPDARAQIIESTTATLHLGDALRDYLCAAMSDLAPADLATVVTAGLRNDEVKHRSIVTSLLRPDDFLVDPLPNLLFTRDSSVWLPGRVAVTSLAMPARMRETQLTNLVYEHHPRFAGVERLHGPHLEHLEGGDVLLLAPGVMAVGVGERTTPAGFERFARQVLGAELARTVLAVPIAQERATMHLDTIVTMVDVDTVVIYPNVADHLRAFGGHLGRRRPGRRPGAVVLRRGRRGHGHRHPAPDRHRPRPRHRRARAVGRRQQHPRHRTASRRGVRAQRGDQRPPRPARHRGGGHQRLRAGLGSWRPALHVLPDRAGRTMTITVEDFEAERPRLMRIAYRLTGSVVDAEDAVQEAWLRLDRAKEKEEPSNLQAWLTRVVSRLCLDRLGSAAKRRETYIGQWLPEPIVRPLGPAAEPDPLDVVVQDEDARLGALVVLDTLTPPQRVAFVLHDVFSVPFDEVGEVLGIGTDAARQHASRARRAVADAPEPTPDPEHEEAVGRFLAAMATGDLDAIVATLHPDVDRHRRRQRHDRHGRQHHPRPREVRPLLPRAVRALRRHGPGVAAAGARQRPAGTLDGGLGRRRASAQLATTRRRVHGPRRPGRRHVRLRQSREARRRQADVARLAPRPTGRGRCRRS